MMGSFVNAGAPAEGAYDRILGVHQMIPLSQCSTIAANKQNWKATSEART
jgi:hypothetical protein